MTSSQDVEHPSSSPSQPINSVELVSKRDGKIVGVSVYSGRAEITRLFKFNVKGGQNQVTVTGLPYVLDQDSLRVEGRGAATIHEVTISRIPRPAVPTTSPALCELLTSRKKASKALERCKKMTASLESYLTTMQVEHVDVNDVGLVVKEYDANGEELDDRTLDLESQLAEIDKQIQVQRTKLAGSNHNDKLNMRAMIGVFAEKEGEVEIALVYAVRGATWHAGYDIRVDMHAKKEPVTLIYKAAISQDTGEDWDDVSLTLETATPTFGIRVPSLDPWKLSLYKPQAKPFMNQATGSMATTPDMPIVKTKDNIRFRTRATIEHLELEVSSQGNVSATFHVPGLINIPSDGVAHNVTIAQLRLDATMSWVCVPKKDAKMHLSAKIKNASQYTLLRGTGSIYVDGSFISRSEVPPVSPEESFDCPLGLDPSIRITYHPRLKKQSQTGFMYNKTTTHLFTQHITVFNTKFTPADCVRIAEQIPVSEDAQIHVNLLNPALPRAGKGEESPEKPVTVAKGVTALWDGADEPEPDVEALGRNGKLNWVCAVPSQGKINLVLQWEVVAPARTEVVGLT